jgi:hypothetical protein
MSTPKRRREEDGQPRMSGTRTKMQLEIPPGNTRAFPEENSRPDRQELTVHSLPRKKNVPGRITRLQPLLRVVAERIRYRRIRLVAFRSSGSPPHTRETGGEKDEFFSFTCCEGVHDEAEPPTEVYIYIYTRAYGPRTPYAYGIRQEEMTGVPPTLGSVWSVQCGVGLSVMFFFSPSCCAEE